VWCRRPVGDLGHETPGFGFGFRGVATAHLNDQPGLSAGQHVDTRVAAIAAGMVYRLLIETFQGERP
jgi:hypothetical protein